MQPMITQTWNILALEERISETYAEYSTATLKRNLYDTYKMAIRWASDRIQKQGIIAFVTNGSWIDGNADSGVRACLAEEFSSIHVLHLRGNAAHIKENVHVAEGWKRVRWRFTCTCCYHNPCQEP